MEYFRLGLRLTIAFALIGSVIVGIFYFTLSPGIAMFAYIYTGIAILTNWLYTAYLLIRLLQKKISARTTLQTVLLMALSIPIALLYSYSMSWMMSYARITFKNQTPYDIPVIKIDGCQEKQIANLNQGESKTVWIKLPVDCKIEIEYTAAGQTRKETVAKFIPVSGGIIASYSLGSNRDITENRLN
jgi:hypothetical protein